MHPDIILIVLFWLNCVLFLVVSYLLSLPFLPFVTFLSQLIPCSIGLSSCLLGCHFCLCSFVCMLYKGWISCFALGNISLRYPVLSTFALLGIVLSLLASSGCALCSMLSFCWSSLPSLCMINHMVCTAALNNHPMHPWSTVISLYGYCRLYRKRNWISVSITAL